MITLIGPIQAIAPVILVAILALILIGWSLGKGHFLPAFPTAAWLVFMSVPFLLSSGGIKPTVATTQAFGISLIALALLIGDGLHVRSLGSMTVRAAVDTENRFNRILMYFFVGFIILIPLYHLANVGSLPLLEHFYDSRSKDAANQREAFNKLLHVPEVFKFTFNWVGMVFGPLVIASSVALARRNKLWYLLAIATFAWIFFYTAVSTARAPFIYFTILSVSLVVVRFGGILSRLGRYLSVVILTVILASGIIRAFELVNHQNTVGLNDPDYIGVMKLAPSKHPLMGWTLGDVARLMGDSKILRVPHLNTITYRAFLVPAEVSSHWYAYFPNVSGEWRDAKELIGLRDAGKHHAANLVGRWAYFERLPGYYLASVSAYASIDADAYSFGGIFAVAIAALALLTVRLIAILAVANPTSSPLGVMMLLFIGLLTTSASLQAILIAQGLAVLLCIYFIQMALAYWKTRPATV